MASACPSGLDLLGRRLAFGLEDRHGPAGVLARPRRRSRVVPVVHGERVVDGADPGAVAGPVPQRAAPGRWRRWRRRGDRSGSTPGRAPRAAPPRRPGSAARRCRAPVRRNVAACVCAPDRAAARPASAAWRRICQRSPAPRAWCVSTAGSANAERLERVEHATVQRRVAARAGGRRRRPGGRGRGGRRRRAARGGSDRPGRARAAAVKPMPSAGSRWSGIASGEQVSRCSRSQASASRSVVRARTASRTDTGRSSPACVEHLGHEERVAAGQLRDAGRVGRPVLDHGRDGLDAERAAGAASPRRSSGPRRRGATAADGRCRAPRRGARRPPATGSMRCGGAGSGAGRWCPGRPSAGRRRRAATGRAAGARTRRRRSRADAPRRAARPGRRRRADRRRRGAGRAAGASRAGRTRPTADGTCAGPRIAERLQQRGLAGAGLTGDQHQAARGRRGRAAAAPRSAATSSCRSSSCIGKMIPTLPAADPVAVGGTTSGAGGLPAAEDGEVLPMSRRPASRTMALCPAARRRRHHQGAPPVKRFIIEREIPGASELTRRPTWPRSRRRRTRRLRRSASRTPGSRATSPATRSTASTRPRTRRRSASTPVAEASRPTR